MTRPVPGRRTVGATLGACAFLIFLATATTTVDQSADPLSASLAAWKLTQYGTLQLPEYAGVAWVESGPAGDLSNRLPGAIAWAVPFYAAFGSDTFSPLPGAIAGAAAGALVVVLLYALALRLQQRVSVAVAAACIGGFATGTWTVSADGPWPHGPTQAAILAGLLLTAARRPLLSGAAFAWAIVTRPHTALIAAGTGLGASRDDRSLRPAVLTGLGAALGVAALLAYNEIVYGGASVLGTYGERATTAQQPGAWTTLPLDMLGVLVSPLRGLLVHSPFLIVLAFGIGAAWRAAPDWARGASIGGLGYLLLQLLGNGFDGGSYYLSYRLPLETLVAASPLLILAWTERIGRSERLIRAFTATVAWSVFVHALAAPGAAVVGYERPWRTVGIWSLVVDEPWRLLPALALTLLTVLALRRVHPMAGPDEQTSPSWERDRDRT